MDVTTFHTSPEAQVETVMAVRAEAIGKSRDASAARTIDAQGSSSEEEWLRVYENAAAVPSTATVLAASTGRFVIRAPQLERSFDGDGIEIYSPHESELSSQSSDRFQVSQDRRM